MGERRTYLLGGRRVAVRDLLEYGLLSAGDVLTFHRPRVGQTHTAIVEDRGSLRVGGRSYLTPSKAACTAAGVTQMDGWTAWVTDQNRTLHSLRSELLDAIAEDAASGEVDDEPPASDETAPDDILQDLGPDESAGTLLPRHVFLKEARAAAENDEPVTVPVRALLARWGGRARGHRISRRIEADLDNHGLTTRPNFMRVSLDDDVTLTAVEPDPEPESHPEVVVAAAADPEGATVLPVVTEEKSSPVIGLTLGNLMSADRVLVSVKPTATLAEAMTLMLMNDYSQLPVLKTKHMCVGAVTWRSIAYAQLKDPAAPLSAAIVPVPVRSYSHELHHLLPLLQEDDFVVVTDNHNAITGIVTTSDVVGLFGERTLPFLLIGELDQELRQLMGAVDFDTIRRICTVPGQKPLASYDDMTMYHYQSVLTNAECWDGLGWPLDRKAFVAQLDVLRRIRNDVMHFNPDGVPDGTVDKLRHMLALIREFGSLEALS